VRVSTLAPQYAELECAVEIASSNVASWVVAVVPITNDMLAIALSVIVEVVQSCRASKTKLKFASQSSNVRGLTCGIVALTFIV